MRLKYLIDVFRQRSTFKLEPMPLNGPLHEVIYGSKRNLDNGAITVIPRKAHTETETSCSVVERESFLNNFNNFTVGLFDEVNWSNVLVVGGSIVSSLLGRTDGFETSDVDIYIYGISSETEFKEKVEEVITCIIAAAESHGYTQHVLIRTPCTVTIGFGYPARNIQIITSRWRSKEHILTTCDVDPTGAGFNGSTVFATPRARFAFNKRCIVVNEFSTQCASEKAYTKRMAKYASRGFCVVDPCMPEDEFAKMLPELGWKPRSLENQNEFDRYLVKGDLRDKEGNLIKPGKVSVTDGDVFINGTCKGQVDNLVLARPPIEVDTRGLRGPPLAVHFGRIAAHSKKSNSTALTLVHGLQGVTSVNTIRCVLDFIPKEDFQFDLSSLRLSSVRVRTTFSMPFGKSVTVGDLQEWATAREEDSKITLLDDPYNSVTGRYEVLDSENIEFPLQDLGTGNGIPFKNDFYRKPEDRKKWYKLTNYLKFIETDRMIGELEDTKIGLQGHVVTSVRSYKVRRNIRVSRFKRNRPKIPKWFPDDIPKWIRFPEDTQKEDCPPPPPPSSVPISELD